MGSDGRPGVSRILKVGIVSLFACTAAFVLITGWALESGGVAIVETRTEAGEPRTTHVWYVEPEGELWLEAGTPENAWFVDAMRDPTLMLRIDDRAARYRIDPIRDAGGHERIRALMREKYGFRDRWVGWLFDTSRSIAVVLRPADA